jgi:hypothetical protein
VHWRCWRRSSCTRTCCTTRHRGGWCEAFGLVRVAGAYDVGQAAPIPAELEWPRERCAGLMRREPEELVQLLVSRYPPGAGIGWDRDAPQFGNVSGIRWDRVPDAVPPRPAPDLGDGRGHP